MPEVQDAFLARLQELAEPKAAPGLPKNWDAIDVGQLVIAQETPASEGWFEAIVTGRDKEMLTLKWRDIPRQHRSPVIERQSRCSSRASEPSSRLGLSSGPGSFYSSTNDQHGSGNGDKSGFRSYKDGF